MKIKAAAIYNKAFSVPRDPRSVAYRLGVLAILKFKCGECKSLICPFPAGTSDSDAWYFGNKEGRCLLEVPS